MGITIWSVTNKSWYLCFVSSLVEQLSCLMPAEKQKQTSRKGGANLEAKARTFCPAPQPAPHWTCWLPEQVESWLYRLRAGRSVFQQLQVAECSLAHSKILAYTLGLRGGYHRDTHKVSAPPSLHCVCFLPHYLFQKILFFFLHTTAFPSHPHLTAKLLFQAYNCTKSINCSQTCQCLRMRPVSVQILKL